MISNTERGWPLDWPLVGCFLVLTMIFHASSPFLLMFALCHYHQSHWKWKLAQEDRPWGRFDMQVCFWNPETAVLHNFWYELIYCCWGKEKAIGKVRRSRIAWPSSSATFFSKSLMFSWQQLTTSSLPSFYLVFICVFVIVCLCIWEVVYCHQHHQILVKPVLHLELSWITSIKLLPQICQQHCRTIFKLNLVKVIRQLLMQ